MIGLKGLWAVVGGFGVLSVGLAHAPHYQVSQTWSHVGATPHFSGVDAKLHKVFISNLAQGTVTVVNSVTGKPISTINVGGVVHTVMVDSQTNRVYVTDIARGRLDVINAKTDKLITEIPVASHLHGLALSQRLHEAFVTDISTNRVYVINMRNNTVVTPTGISVGPNPWGVAVNPRTRTLYVANTGINLFPTMTVNPQGDSVSVVNLRDLKVTQTIPVGPHPWNLAVNSKTGNVYVGVSGANTVAVIHRNHVVKDIPVGQSPHGLALDAKLNRLFVNDSLSNQVSVIDTQTNQLSQTLAVGSQPQGVTINQKTGWVYAVNQQSASVSVLTPSFRLHGLLTFTRRGHVPTGTKS